MIIQPSFGGCLHLRIAIPVDKNRPSLAYANGAVHRKKHPPSVFANVWCIAKNILHQYLPTCGASQKTITAEERFNMLARGWPDYPVTPAAHATTAEERL